MKLKLLVAGLVLLSHTSKAQFGEKGQRVIGGSIGVSHSSSSALFNQGVSNTTTDFSLSLGKFKQQNVLSSFFISGGFSGMRDKNTISSSQDYSTAHFGAGYSKIWFKPIGKKFFFGIGGTGSISYGNVYVGATASSNSGRTRSYGISMALVPILSYQLSNRFVANITPAANFLRASYTHMVRTSNGAATVTLNNYNFNAGFSGSLLESINIGFNYLLKRR